ncbi:MAG: metallophosphoesterase family protein [Atribacterota bacterium]|nr:metallophosphoesterase family protein [Atribacterota bacterium]
MKIAILSDIHGNFDALEKVSLCIEAEKIMVLGDTVGYGAQPEECVQWVITKKAQMVMGNHEACLLGVLPLSWFNPQAREAVLWTRERLSTFSLSFLQSLPLTCFQGSVFWVHGSLREPVEEYVTSAFLARTLFEQFSFWVCFFGHTHVAEGYVYQNGRVEWISFVEGGEIILSPEKRYLINCGSVGQPRDGNPAASFGIYDLEKQRVEIWRLEYNVGKAVQRILQAGLPEGLAYRLWEGR